LSNLTDGDLELLSLVAAGKTTEEISAQLNRSINTIKSRKSRIISKLGVNNMAEAVFRSVHQIADWRRDNGQPDDSISGSPWLAKGAK
jgi:DNA-binding NarL/FixJ family response regulator